MINKITIKDVASYKEATLKTDKKVNLIYGLNASGKTTIADYLQNPNDFKFKECSVEGIDFNAYDVLVYNENFVKENFYEPDVQKGIFTIAKENKQALENIKNANKKKENHQNALQELTKQETTLKEKMERYTINAHNKIWEIIEKYVEKGTIFYQAGFLHGFKGSKEKLFDYVFDIELVKEVPSLQKIEKALRELQEESPRYPLQSIKNKCENILSSIETDGIYEKEIVGNKNSSVSTLINELKNSDWVKDGLEKYVDLRKGDFCPFCQEKTLTEELINNIENHFDKAYKKDMENITRQKEKYADLISHLNPKDYRRDFYTEEQKIKTNDLFNQLIRNLEKNIQKINEKSERPSQPIKLNSSENFIDAYEIFINEINTDIERHTKNQQNKHTRRRELEEQFLKIMRKEYNPHIESYNQHTKEFNQTQNKIQNDFSDVTEKIKAQDAIIQENQKQTLNIEKTIRQINRHLRDFGINYFEIKKHSAHDYILKRKNGNADGIFQSLSEGEKTVISFLYFIEMCIGQKNRNAPKPKIVVIDDPISSLSHIYVYNVATLIKNIFIKDITNDFEQCFIMTHNLYFFHEINLQKLNKELRNKINLFRIVRGDYSIIEVMKTDEIQNEYQTYWSIIKNEKSIMSATVVANAMRNIIEYFFGLVYGDNKLEKIFAKDELRKDRFESFKRYIDRESHSVPQNTFDYKDFNMDVFKEAFKEIFIVSGYEEHYNKMMELPSNPDNPPASEST